MRLKARVAIITGGGRGIGRAIAERFAREGAAVMVSSRTETELRAVVAAMEAAGGRAAHLAGDVSDEAFAARLVQATRERWAEIDILVNNAGIYGAVKAVSELAPGDWDEVIEVNLRSAFLLTRAVLPGMVARRRGAVLNISSISAKAAFPWGSAYAASKAGMLALTRVAAAEVAGAGVRVNALCPGPVDTKTWEELGRALAARMNLTREKLEELVRAGILQGRRQTVEEVAAAALFLCSDDASAITGQALNVDGGELFY